VRKLFAQIHVSVDGYFDGPNQELDWFVLDDEFFAYVEEMLGSIGGILLAAPPMKGSPPIGRIRRNPKRRR